MVRPTTADVKLWSRIDFGALDEAYSDAELDVLVLRANDYVEDVTGREMDATAPAEYASILGQCVQMRTEQLALQSQPDYVETGTDDLISNFSAGSYSETRRDQRGGSPQGVFPPVNAWPALNSLLVQAMTDAKRDFWLERLGITDSPAFETTEVDWGWGGGMDRGLTWGA